MQTLHLSVVQTRLHTSQSAYGGMCAYASLTLRHHVTLCVSRYCATKKHPCTAEVCCVVLLWGCRHDFHRVSTRLAGVVHPRVIRRPG